MDNSKISHEFIEYFNKFGDNESLRKILTFILNQDVNINVLNSEKHQGFIGLATLYGIYFNLKLLDKEPNNIKCFIILHELAHLKRMHKLGKDKIISDLSEKDFDLFCDKIINEEIIADRYASLLYFKLTKNTYPQSMTQQLYINSNKLMYKNILRGIHGLNDGTEKTYKKKLKEIFDINV